MPSSIRAPYPGKLVKLLKAVIFSLIQWLDRRHRGLVIYERYTMLA